jgi:hypothetical protein
MDFDLKTFETFLGITLREAYRQAFLADAKFLNQLGALAIDAGIDRLVD